jgi:histidine triad (HIT) family protein
MNQVADCVFCQWETDADQRLVDRTDAAVFLQNAKQQGALVGSGVIVPVRHAATVFDLSDDELRDTFMLLGRVKARMDATYHPDGYNIGWNCGAVAVQEINPLSASDAAILPKTLNSRTSALRRRAGCTLASETYTTTNPRI